MIYIVYGGFLYGKIYITERFIPWKGSTRSLKTFKGKKAIICVGGGSMKRFGFLQKAEDYLKEAGMEVKLFEALSQTHRWRLL